jgi:hypothetical protein
MRHQCRRERMRGADVPDSDTDRWEDDLAAEVLKAIQQVRIDERGRLLPSQVYVRELLDAHRPTPGRMTPETARAYVERSLPKKFFRDLFDPERPTRSDFVRRQAAGAATEEVRRKREMFSRYGDTVVDPEAALSHAYSALLVLGDRVAPSDPPQPEVRNPYAFFVTVVKGLIHHEIDENMKHAAPGRREHYKLMLRFRKQLELDEPDRDEVDREREATRMADELLAALGRLLDRIDFEEAEAHEGDSDLVESIQGEIMLDVIEDLVSRSPFTPTDRDTWRRWRAVDFRGEDIPWVVSGLTGSAGPQRLLVLRRKLRKLLGDLGYGDR